MPLTISLKSASADLTDSTVFKAVTALAVKAATTQRAQPMPAGPSLDITFMLPGKFDKPAFSGMRMGGYDAVGATLFFEKAVPEHIVHAQKSHEYLALVLHDVVTNAIDFFAEHQLPFNAGYWQHFIQQIVGTADTQSLIRH